MRPEIATLMDLARTIPIGELPEFVGNVEQLKAIAWIRLAIPVAHESAQRDRQIDIDEAAGLLGVSESYLYQNHWKYPFTRREGRRLKFSANGIAAYIGRNESLTPRRQRPKLRPVG